MGEDKKLNCWEFMKCGREPGGRNETELGTCSACTEERLDGVHGGRNAGRSCWVVAETFCKGKVSGTYAERIDTCRNCEFFRMVSKEEGGNLRRILYLEEMVRKS